MSDEIKHYGVKGMKWGVRRFQPYRKGERVKGGKEVGKAKSMKSRYTDAMDKANAKSAERTSKRREAIKSAPKKAASSYKKAMDKANTKSEERRKKYHAKKKPHSIYGQAYSKAKERGVSESTAMRAARTTEVLTKAYAAQSVMGVIDNVHYGKTGTTVTNNARRAAYLGKEIGKAAGRYAMTSDRANDARRLGKNIMQAVSGNSVRYVDGSKMTNVVNVGTELITR